jgi:type II secretory pathway component PulF
MITLDKILKYLLILLLNIIPQFTEIVNSFVKDFTRVTVVVLTTFKAIKKNLAAN